AAAGHGRRVVAAARHPDQDARSIRGVRHGAWRVVNKASAPVLPARYQVVERQEETRDTVTLWLRPVDQPIPEYRPGQFTMLYAPGIGEVPISISGTGPDFGLVQTVRAVGAVTRALCSCAPGKVIGVRGPYGTDWDVASAAGDDLLIVAGGIGLAPL